MALLSAEVRTFIKADNHYKNKGYDLDGIIDSTIRYAIGWIEAKSDIVTSVPPVSRGRGAPYRIISEEDWRIFRQEAGLE